MIRLENICKIYGTGEGRVKALNGIDLTIEKGDMLSVMGTSGSGKSTLLNILGCMDRATSGDYYYDDVHVSALSAAKLDLFRKQKIGFVFQDFALLPNYTVYESIEMPLIAQNMPGRKRRKTIERVVERLGITDLMDKKISTLSGGQKQRCAIGRAVAKDSELILADEPTGALDSKNGEEIMKLFCELNEEGRTIVVITHDTGIADYCKRHVRIEDGSILL